MRARPGQLFWASEELKLICTSGFGQVKRKSLGRPVWSKVPRGTIALFLKDTANTKQTFKSRIHRGYWLLIGEKIYLYVGWATDFGPGSFWEPVKYEQNN